MLAVLAYSLLLAVSQSFFVTIALLASSPDVRVKLMNQELKIPDDIESLKGSIPHQERLHRHYGQFAHERH